MKKLHATVKRPLTLFSVTAWSQGYSVYLERALGWRYPILFHFDGVKAHFYHTEGDFAYFKHVLSQKLIANESLFERLNREFLRDTEELKRTAVVEKSLPRIWELTGRIMLLYMFIVSDTFVKAVPAAWKSREASERILYEVDDTIEELFKKKLISNGYDQAFAKVLTQNDFLGIEKRGLDVDALAARLNGYIVEGDELTVGVSFEDFCHQHNFIFKEEVVTPTSTLKGNVAYKGKAKGRVVLVFQNSDIDKVQERDILVSIMTNANYLPAMKRAAAIITDEGGITCHAAIAARELRKPCIVGTKFATKIFKEGDVVEVDADAGMITK